MAATGLRRVKESRAFNYLQESSVTLLAFLAIATAWQAAASVYPSYLFPSVVVIGLRFLSTFADWAQFSNVLATVGRILAGFAGAFLLGGLLAILMLWSRKIERFIFPILNVAQGVPALSWVVFAIIWFNKVEPRIFFIMVVTTIPAFTFQISDALRSMSNDLFEMALSFRPTNRQILRIVIFPSILPGILTSWKVNIGNAARVVVVAELVGATGGVGYKLMQQQQIFDMAGAVAWTMQLVVFVLLVQKIISIIEANAFRYRAVSERSL